MSFARRSLQVVAFICTLVVGVAAMALIVTQTTWFKEWLRGFIVRQAEDYVNGRLSIGRLDGNLFFGVQLEDVDVTQNGQTVVDIKDLRLDYNVFTVLGGDVVLDEIRLNQPTLRVVKTADGWNLANLIKAQTPDPDEPTNRRALAIDELGITDGTLYLEGDVVGTSGVEAPERIEKLDASLGITSNEDVLSVDVKHVSLRAAEPRFGVNAMSGVITRRANAITIDNFVLRTEESSVRVHGSIQNIESDTPAVDLTASSEKLALQEVARLLPALEGYALQPAFTVTATGPADRLAVDLDVREQTLGHAAGELTVDAAGAERRVAGTVTMQNVNIGPVARSATLSSDITGQARFDLALPSGRLPLSGTYDVDASRVAIAGYEVRDLDANGRIDGNTIRLNADAAAYGGRATIAGTVRTGEPLALDLSGRAADLDLRNLPPAVNAPGVPSDLQLAFNVRGRGQVFSGDVRFEESTLAGARVATGTTARFTVGDGAPRYAATGEVAGLDLEQIGRGLNISALATPRYASRINATFDVQGSGGGRYPLTLNASGSAVDSQMFGASFPRLDFSTQIADGDLTTKAVGQFAGLDPSAVSGDARFKGSVSGAVDVNTTIRDYAAGVTPESIAAAGRVNLGQSTVGGLTINSAAVDGRFADRTGEVTQVSITGPDLTVNGQGTLALDETGASNLTLHVETPSLDRIGTIIGQPLKGAAVVDATVTGNAGQLQVAGHLQGSAIGHGENEALSLAGDFTVAVPQLRPADAKVQARTTATFLEIGGQRITELTADTTYAGSNLAFMATAKEGVRELTAGGDVTFHPDHQEVHVDDLVLQSEMIRWASADGEEATVRYAGDRIEVDNLRLVNGNQRIEADGVIGDPSRTLQVRVDNVDVSQLDRLMLGDQRLAGFLSANATISGETSAPTVEGEFTLAQGAFREFRFDALTGTVDYARQGVELDVRLQQNPQAWLTAKGYAPVTLFRPTPPESQGHVPPAGPADAVNIEVASSQIDLGVVQGFTSYVTDVTGTMQANLKVTGSGYDPHLDGAVDIRKGAFAVPDLGTNYSGLDTRVELNADGLSIREFKILDSRGFPMTVGGTLAMHAREVGAVDISIQSDMFEVIDNELADLKLNTQVRITGELRKPRVEGSVEVENGTIHVARVLEMATADAYATEATEINPEQPAPAGPAPQTPPTPTIFDALEMNVGLVVPSNLVLRGQDLRAANAPIELGDVNITVGGQLDLRKEPGGRLRIGGEVNTVRGNYTFQGRRFDIMRDGRIRFAGTDEIDPALDLRASREISGVQTIIRVQGSVRQPELSFSSNPPLEQADILSLIVFNASVNELGEGQQVSLAERAGALAGGYLTSGLSRSIGNALELDEFEIQAQGENGGGPSLSIGEQVGEKLFFRVRQAFGEAQATEFILEYQIADYLRLQTSIAETSGGTQRLTFRRVERGGLDLIFFFAY